MTSNKPIIYLAGFECFLPNAKELAQQMVDLCDKYGFKGISPVLGDENGKEIDFSQGKQLAAKQIFNKNIEFINKCDLIIANLNCFRGWELDAGTCFEVGYAYSQNKKLYGYMDDTRPCFEKYVGNIHFDGAMWRDDNGAFFESGCCNLMINAPAKVVQGTLEQALIQAKADFNI